MGEIMRLDKLVASQFADVSRADVKKLCLKKKISVNGKLVARSDAKVNTDDEIIIDGKKLTYKKHIYIMLNKPAGVVCSTKESASRTVLDLVPDELRRDGLPDPCHARTQPRQRLHHLRRRNLYRGHPVPRQLRQGGSSGRGYDGGTAEPEAAL